MAIQLSLTERGPGIRSVAPAEPRLWLCTSHALPAVTIMLVMNPAARATAWVAERVQMPVGLRWAADASGGLLMQEGPATCTLHRPVQAVTCTSWPGSSAVSKAGYIRQPSGRRGPGLVYRPLGRSADLASVR